MTDAEIISLLKGGYTYREIMKILSVSSNTIAEAKFKYLKLRMMHVVIPAKLHKKLKLRAIQDDITLQKLVTKIIGDYLK